MAPDTPTPAPQVDPFRSQEPWVYATASFDRPPMPLERDDVRVLRAAGSGLERALAGGAQREDARQELAACELDHPQGSAALQAARALLAGERPPWETHVWLAQLALALEQPEACARHLERAVASEPRCPRLSRQPAALERRLGRLDRAQRHAGAMLEHDPSSPHAHAELGQIARARGDDVAAREHFAGAARHAGGDELLLREVDGAVPGLLVTGSEAGEARMDAPCAVLIPGQLRRMDASAGFLEGLAGRCDLFVCTNAEYRRAAAELAAATGASWRVIEDDPDDARAEESLPVNSMKQWLKLERCIRLMLEVERRRGLRYRYVYKLRTDYHLLRPGSFLDLERDEQCDGLLAASDKVFGGRREYVLPLAGLLGAMRQHFLDQQQRYWPVRVPQVLRSSDSFKWFGMLFPRQLVGRPRTVAALRRSVAEHAGPLEAHRPRPLERYVRLFEGHPRMASEVCFARYLNFLGIEVRSSPRLAGFLLSDRR